MVNRERFQLTDHEPTLEGVTVPIHEVITSVFGNIDANDRSWLRELEKEWSVLIGPAADHARLGRFNRKMLVIYVDSSVWLNELVRYERAGMLARLQKRFGAERIKGIRFQAEPGVSPVDFIARRSKGDKNSSRHK